jgi:hypothetical protein
MRGNRAKKHDSGAVEARPGRVDFSRPARESVARFREIWQKHGVFPSIETLDAFRYGKINPPWTRARIVMDRRSFPVSQSSS